MNQAMSKKGKATTQIVEQLFIQKPCIDKSIHFHIPFQASSNGLHFGRAAYWLVMLKVDIPCRMT
jgi:hypothetical protein